MDFEVIDFHIHPFYNDENNLCFYQNTVKDIQEIKYDLKRAGISKACGSVIKRLEGTDFNEIKLLNDEALMIRDKLDGLYVPGIHITPLFVEESCCELKRMYDKNVNLVGELVPYLMGWADYYDKNLHEIYKCIEKFDMVVSVHTKNEETLEKAVKKFPKITFVAAHPGDKDSFLRHIERMKKYENYYLDLSGTGIFRYGLIRYGVNIVGSERFLFGSDYPICNPYMYINAVLYEKLSEKDYENIFSKNAKRVLKLK